MQTGTEAPFKVTIKPRSQAYADLILQECNSVADELAQLEFDGGKGQYTATS
jgi:hypothetical protein